MTDRISKISVGGAVPRILVETGNQLPSNAVIQGVAAGRDGSVYAVDRINHVLYKISPDGRVNGVLIGDIGTAGTTLSTGMEGSDGLDARLNEPFGVAVDINDNVYVTTWGSDQVYKIAHGRVQVLAGSGYAGDIVSANGHQAAFNNPSGLDVDQDGVVYVADSHNHKIKKIWPSGRTITLAGSGTAGYANGQGNAAQFSSPADVAVDNRGNVYVADRGNRRIRRIDPNGNVVTLAGSGQEGFADGQGAEASFSSRIASVAVDPQGTLWVVDTDNQAIRRISENGNVATYRSWNAQTTGTSALFSGLYAGTGLTGKIYRTTGATWAESADVGETSAIYSMFSHGGYLYAGTDEGRILRSADGVNWTTVKAGASQELVYGLAELNGVLYAGTSSGTMSAMMAPFDTTDPRGVVYRSTDGVTWIKSAELDDSIFKFHVFKGKLFAGTGKSGKILVSTNGFNWTNPFSFEANPGGGKEFAICFATYNDTMYVGTLWGNIYKSSDGVAWSLAHVTGDVYVSSMATFNGYLYIGTAASATIYRTNNGTDWTQVEELGDADIPAMMEHGGYLYAGSTPSGMLVRSADGQTWSATPGTDVTDFYSMATFDNRYWAPVTTSIALDPVGNLYVLEKNV